MDSLDWPEEYHLRFGLLHVDFATQRTPKASFGWHLDLTRLVGNLFDCRGGLRDLVQARGTGDTRGIGRSGRSSERSDPGGS